MRKFWLAQCVAIGAVMAVALHAQTQTPANSSDANRVTVTGCIERASSSPSPTGTAGTAGAATADTKFVLAKAKAGAPSPTGTAGSAPSRSSSMAASQYRLDDADESKIAPHVGHKVEIAGTLDSAGSSSASPSPSASPSAAPSASRSSASAPKLKVESVKMIAATCSE